MRSKENFRKTGEVSDPVKGKYEEMRSGSRLLHNIVFTRIIKSDYKQHIHEPDSLCLF